MHLEGIVETLNIKTTSKAGKTISPLYSFKVQGEWIGCGFDSPGVAEGNNIGFDYTVGGYGNELVKGSITRLAQGASASPVAAAKPTADQRQLSIVYQSSRKDAISILTSLVGVGVVKLPAKVGYETMLEMVDDLAMDLAEKALSPVIEPKPVVEVVTDE